jgi:hypothetical protein
MAGRASNGGWRREVQPGLTPALRGDTPDPAGVTGQAVRELRASL